MILKYKAFTLLEILLVITIVGILLTVVVRLVRPEDRFADIRNAQRKSDVLSIYTAINQYKEDNRGQFPSGITSTSTNLCQPGCVESGTQIDINADIASYIRNGVLPIDPSQTGTVLTGYTVSLDSGGRVIVSASLAENGELINTQE